MFLTQLDPRAAVKGSRDPLAFQAIWSHFGREVVGNLTTVTQSLRDFMTLLFGFYFVEKALERGRGREEERCGMFLQFEQLAAYSLYASGATEDGGAPMRGINRVRARLDSLDKVRISPEREYQILSNQKIYGLWGLYSSAARESGWLEPEEQRLNPATAAFAERAWWQLLGKEARRTEEALLRYLGANALFEPRGRDAPLARALEHVLMAPPDGELQQFLVDSLVRNHLGSGSTRGLQAQLWSTLEHVNGRSARSWSRRLGVQELRQLLQRASTEERLHGALDRIERVERVLAPAGRLFQFLLSKNGRKVDSVAAEVRKAWGPRLKHLDTVRLRELEARLAEAVGLAAAQRVVHMQEALASGDYAGFCVTAAEHNALAMQERGGASWLSVENQRLKVRLKAELAWLPESDELNELWVNSYFLNSLKQVGAQVTGRMG